MIEKSKLLKVVNSFLEENDLFLVDLSIERYNEIFISIDGMNGINVQKCIELTRLIEEHFDRDVEDYELEVASGGLTEPFKVIQQYEKNIGKLLEVTLKTKEKLEGTLVSVNPTEISFNVEKNVKLEGKKKKEKVIENKIIKFDDIKSTVNIIVF